MMLWTDAVRSREHELRLEVVQLPSNRFEAVLSARDDETLRGEFALPFSPAEVTAAVATAKGQTEQHIARSHQDLPADPLRELGRLLFDAVFEGRRKALLDRRRDRAREAGIGLRLRVVPQGANGRDTRWLPWEFLYDSRRRDFLALSMLSRVVRDTGRSELDPMTRLIDPPVRVLVVAADSTGALEVADEVEKLRAIAKRKRDRLRLTVVEDATAEECLAAARKPGHHVLHFIGAGLPGGPAGPAPRAGLLLMPPDRQPLAGGQYRAEQVVTAEALRDAVAQNPDLRLAVFDACETDEVAAQVAGELQGAVGVRGNISVPACTAFAYELYRAVGRGEPLDTAVTSARRQVDHRLTGSREWGLQVFYLQAPDGELARWQGADPWSGSTALGDALEAAHGQPAAARKAAVRRVMDRLNHQALLDQIDRADGEVPDVVREQLKAITARLKSS